MLNEIRVPAQTPRSVEEGSERRGKPRICVPFHAKVQGIDGTGKEFTIETVLDNFSGNGLYMRMMPSVQNGSQLAIVVGLQVPSQVTNDVPRVSIDGVVLRSQKMTGGAYGVAVNFSHIRFL